METAVKASGISRIDFRYRHSAQDIVPKEKPVQEEEEEAESSDDVQDPLLIREQKGRVVMGRAHRMFHRRAAVEPSNVLTVVVDVVATVDSSGNTIALATSTPGLVNVQAVTSAIVLPSVPAVPPFPSDLTVPAYPFPSGVPSAQPSVSSSVIPSSVSVPTSSTSGASSAVSSATPSPTPSNSTIFTSIPSSTFLSTLNSTSLESTSSWSSSAQSYTSTQSSSLISTTTSDVATATSSLGGGGGDPANTDAPAPAPTTLSVDAESKATAPLETPKVVGSVIGSLAGAALFLAIILLLLRRHKRKLQDGATRQITADDAADSQPMASSGQEMATRHSYVPASTAAFFNRFSGASRSTADTSTTAGGGERGFQRISGRKLPSAFSEGMTSEQVARDSKLSGLSGASFYQDDKGFYGGPGLAMTKETGEPSTSRAGERIVTMPSPARTPTIHHPPPPFGTSRNGGSSFSPPHSPNPSIPPRGTLGRSHPSHDGSRNSRFTEDV